MTDGSIPAERRIFVNRTLNLRAIRAVGFDMDYTLVHYRVEEWERRAYEHARAHLAARGWPVQDLRFDAELVTVGLVLDLELGNLIKATRFGYVTRAEHGTRELTFEQQRQAYSRVLVDLREPRWLFLNTLFSLSEATLFSQCVDLLDAGKLDPTLGYAGLYRVVKSAVDATHMEGALKAEIAENPGPFVELDPDLPRTLLDLKEAGKLLLLVTNSEWSYTRAILSYALDPALPGRMSFRELFDLVVVSARKPEFFTGHSALFEIVDDSGLLRPALGPMKRGGLYLGGNARSVEQDLGLAAEEILYVGDHLYADVHVTKDMLRWRTALILREMEREVTSSLQFRPAQDELNRLMAQKVALEHRTSLARLELQRGEHGAADPEAARARLTEIRAQVVELDQRIAPLADAAGRVGNPHWGLLMRAGLDKSYLARQVERYADIYTSRVSNFSLCSPHAYLRAPRVTLPHDPDAGWSP